MEVFFWIVNFLCLKKTRSSCKHNYSVFIFGVFIFLLLSRFCDYAQPESKNTFRTKSRYTLGGLLYINQWGPLRYAANSAFLCAMAADQGIDSAENRWVCFAFIFSFCIMVLVDGKITCKFYTERSNATLIAAKLNFQNLQKADKILFMKQYELYMYNNP